MFFTSEANSAFNCWFRLKEMMYRAFLDMKITLVPLLFCSICTVHSNNMKANQAFNNSDYMNDWCSSLNLLRVKREHVVVRSS